MSFSTYYKFEGELHHCGKHDLERHRDEAKETIDALWKRLLILAASTPKVMTTDSGHSIEWIDYIQDEMQNIREEMEEATWSYHRYCDALAAQKEDPNNVHDDADEWDEENQKWIDCK